MGSHMEWMDRGRTLAAACRTPLRESTAGVEPNHKSREVYQDAMAALQARLDPVSLTLAVQDFRHLVQGDDEKVADFICRLEHKFKLAFG